MDRRQYARDLRGIAVELLELAAVMEEPRTIATTRAIGCTCDTCGNHLIGLRWIGEPCESTIRVLANCGTGYIDERCTGTYRLDPEPATDRAGNPLGVSLAGLAAEQAIRDFMADDPDHIADEWPDMASTYRGRAR